MSHRPKLSPAAAAATCSLHQQRGTQRELRRQGNRAAHPDQRSRRPPGRVVFVADRDGGGARDHVDALEGEDAEVVVDDVVDAALLELLVYPDLLAPVHNRVAGQVVRADRVVPGQNVLLHGSIGLGRQQAEPSILAQSRVDLETAHRPRERGELIPGETGVQVAQGHVGSITVVHEIVPTVGGHEPTLVDVAVQPNPIDDLAVDGERGVVVEAGVVAVVVQTEGRAAGLPSGDAVVAPSPRLVAVHGQVQVVEEVCPGSARGNQHCDAAQRCQQRPSPGSLSCRLQGRHAVSFAIDGGTAPPAPVCRRPADLPRISFTHSGRFPIPPVTAGTRVSCRPKQEEGGPSSQAPSRCYTPAPALSLTKRATVALVRRSNSFGGTKSWTPRSPALMLTTLCPETESSAYTG